MWLIPAGVSNDSNRKFVLINGNFHFQLACFLDVWDRCTNNRKISFPHNFSAAAQFVCSMLSLSSYCICLLSTFPPWHQSSSCLAAPACFWQNGVALKWRPFCSYMATYIYKRLKTALRNLQQLDYALQPLILHWHQNILFFLLTSWWEVSSDNASRSQEESLPSNTRLH